MYCTQWTSRFYACSSEGGSRRCAVSLLAPVRARCRSCVPGGKRVVAACAPACPPACLPACMHVASLPPQCLHAGSQRAHATPPCGAPCVLVQRCLPRGGRCPGLAPSWHRRCGRRRLSSATRCRRRWRQPTRSAACALARTVCVARSAAARERRRARAAACSGCSACRCC